MWVRSIHPYSFGARKAANPQHRFKLSFLRFVFLTFLDIGLDRLGFARLYASATPRAPFFFCFFLGCTLRRAHDACLCDTCNDVMRHDSRLQVASLDFLNLGLILTGCMQHERAADQAVVDKRVLDRAGLAVPYDQVAGVVALGFSQRDPVVR